MENKKTSRDLREHLTQFATEYPIKNDPRIQVQLQALGLFSEFLTRPWKQTMYKQNKEQTDLKILLLAVLIVSLAFGWESKGVRYVDLNRGDYDEAGNIVFFLMIGMVSLLFLLCVLTYSVARSPRLFPPCLDLVISSSLSLLTFIASVILAHSLSNLGKSLAVREAGLKFAALQATLIFGLALAMLFAVSAAFAFCYYRRKTDYMMSDSRNMADLPDDIPT